jgi:hypothetical protein
LSQTINNHFMVCTNTTGMSKIKVTPKPVSETPLIQIALYHHRTNISLIYIFVFYRILGLTRACFPRFSFINSAHMSYFSRFSYIPI